MTYPDLNKPLISVGMPVYNMGDTIEASLLSVVNQTYKNLEIIISDNCSTDSTSLVLNRIAAKDKRIKIFRQDKTLTAVLNFQFVLQKACGDYFKWHAADDLIDVDLLSLYLDRKKYTSLRDSLMMCTYASYELTHQEISHIALLPKLNNNKHIAAYEYLRKPIPSAYYGLFNRKKLIQLFVDIKDDGLYFDWSDVYIVSLYIYNNGAIFMRDKAPLYYAGYKLNYKPKPVSKYISCSTFNLKIFRFFGIQHPYIIWGLLRVNIISLLLNSQIFISHLNQAKSNSVKTINKILSFLRFKSSLQRLSKRYPSSKYIKLKNFELISYSQYSQDIILVSLVGILLRSRKSLQVLDIGANHPTNFSNTYLLENIFANLQVIAVDPLNKMHYEWQRLRPNTIFLRQALSSENKKSYVKVPKSKSDMFSSLVDSIIESDKSEYDFEEVDVTSLPAIVNKYINKDFILLMDIEGHEEKVLTQLSDCERKPLLLLIENNADGLLGSNRLRDMIIDDGYSYLGRVGPNDDLFVSCSVIDELPGKATIA